MPFTAADAIAQLDILIADIESNVTPHRWMDGHTSPKFQGDSAVGQRLMTRALAAVDRLAPAQSRYVEDARGSSGRGSVEWEVPRLAGVLRALRDDYEAGYMQSVEELIHADVFADFLDMADELHGKGYKDPAAVIAGSVLEEHLRKLAIAHGDPVESEPGKPLKADTINAGLAKSAYNKLDQKSVTAWLDLRNKAAHGRYAEYDDTQVAALIRDIRAFMSRHPA